MRLLPALAFVLAIHSGWVPLSAQQGPSPLVGKTVLVYNPAPGEVLNVDMSGTGHPMTALPGNWLAFTIPATIQSHINRFGIRNNYGQGSFWLNRTGVATNGADAFAVTDFAGGDSLWIIVDPSGPATAPPHLLTQAPKVINVLNPWEATGPALAFAGGTSRLMRTLPEHCGWFTTFLFNPGDLQVHFAEIGGSGHYGKGGLGDPTPYDLAAEFALQSRVSTLWLDTERNAWLPAFPGKFGICEYRMAVTVRDFSGDHPDFDFGTLPGDFSAPGRVEPVLGADRRPVRSAAPSLVKDTNLFNHFDSWWRTDTTHASPALRSYETCVDIPMSKTGDGLWEYESYQTPERGFWPIEDFANPNNVKLTRSCYNNPASPGQWTTGGPATNMNFCMEAHAVFTYRPGQKFVFRGNDDVWVFIDNKLVIDLGGIHVPMTDSVDLDKLGLTAGSQYKWDFFHCDRQPCGSSLRIKTSIFFKQQRALEAAPIAGAGPSQSFRIIKRVGGSGSCGGSADSVMEVPVTRLTYQLRNARGEVVHALAEGSRFGGGLVIATPTVTVDTSRLADSLPAGAYRLVAFEPSNPSIHISIPLQVGPVSTALRPIAKVRPRIRKPRFHDALGRARQARGTTFNR